MVNGEDGRSILDASHQGAIIVIFMPTFLCPATLFVLSTMIVRRRNGVSVSWTWTNPVLWDFVGLTTMLILTIAWTILACLQTRVGLGAIERPHYLNAFEKLEYALELLYLLAIMMWKITNGMSSAQIFGLADDRRRRQSSIIAASIAVMFLATFFACAFQCQGPNFWAIRSQPKDNCFNRVGGAIEVDWLVLPAFWTSVAAVDILTDPLIHGFLLLTIVRSHMVLSQKKTAVTIVSLYLTTYVATAGTRLAFISRFWDDPEFALIAGWTTLSTFSQLVFPMTVLCLGKLSKLLDLESYFSAAIGTESRRAGQRRSRQYYPPQSFGRNLTDASGPVSNIKMYTDSVEEMPLRERSRSTRQAGSGELDIELSDAITVKRDVDVSSEHDDENF